MSGTRILVDTNILILLLNGDEFLSKFLSSCEVHISFITQIELLASKKLTRTEVRAIEALVKDCYVHHSSEPMVRLAALISADSGVKLPDAIIAASAMELGFPLLSADSDFNKLDNLEFIHFNI